MNKNTVLITGGTGFIGSHLIDKCKKKGWNIISISLNNKNKKKGVKSFKLNQFLITNRFIGIEKRACLSEYLLCFDIVRRSDSFVSITL